MIAVSTHKDFLEPITDKITRIRVPFDNIYTSVFVVAADTGTAVLDCATTESDVTEYIMPALNELGASPSLILASHFHGDHMGGLPHLAARFPDAEIAVFDPSRVKGCSEKHIHAVKDGEILLGCLRVLHLPGHSPDSIALLDERSGSLLSFDCLQAFGIGQYGTGIANVADYLMSIEKASSENMEILVAAHEYVPTGSTAMGRAAIDRYFDSCREAVQQLCAFAKRFPDLSAEELAARFRLAYPDLPTVSRFTFEAVKKHLNQRS